jgi:superfamily II DNA/RNA helicase
MERKYFASIDLGSNSSRLLIVDEFGNIAEKENVKIRLAEGMQKNVLFTGEAMQRGYDCFEKFAECLAKYNIVASRFIATEACRQAKNGNDFIKNVKDRTGIDIEIISGEEEARLTAFGCKPNVKKNKKYVLITDIGERVLVTTLTKKMAEDLTDYLNENGIKVRYMHSDIDTIERIEIIRDLRLGVFDVLIGINLLREGLDIPECSLVAILDADKEGFLRSNRSLIQTIGRAARNAEGRVILYADKMTKSLKESIDETERRRKKQIQFNQANGITPKTIKKAISDIASEMSNKDYVDLSKNTTQMNPKEITEELKILNKKMKDAAANLEFEKAMVYRDKIIELEKKQLQI